MQRLFALRGATSAENTPTSILQRSLELYLAILEKNQVVEADIVSLQISVTEDLTALNPASALRRQGHALEVPLFCAQEPKYEGSRPRILRFLLHFYGDESLRPEGVYLHEAADLRASALANSAIGKSQNGHEGNCAYEGLWLISREYAGLAEAGGLKTVVRALAEGIKLEGIRVKVFLPRYSFMELEGERVLTLKLMANGVEYETSFIETHFSGVDFVLIESQIFSSKKGIYTYTEEEAALVCKAKGESYEDSNEMNIVFQLAVLEYAEKFSRKNLPKVIHCHDGQTAFLPALFAERAKVVSEFKALRFFVTMHNAGDSYRQQLYDKEYAHRLTGLEYSVLENGMIDCSVEPFLVSTQFATLTTVSPWYADELTRVKTPFSYKFSLSLAEKKIPIVGITNGIDYAAYDPKNTSVSKLPIAYDPSAGDFAGKYELRRLFLESLAENSPNENLLEAEGVCRFGKLVFSPEKPLYFSYHGRIVHQKGIDILLETIDRLCEKSHRFKFLVMGQGTRDFEEACIKMCEKNLGNVVFFKGYNKKIARLVNASADFILLPSLFEPCGLEDLIAQIYGTIPIAHAIGGLQKIQDGKTGFLFSAKNPESKFDKNAIVEALTEKILTLSEEFFTSPYSQVLDNPRLAHIILNANREIKNTYNWKNIIKKYYRPLYGL